MAAERMLHRYETALQVIASDAHLVDSGPHEVKAHVLAALHVLRGGEVGNVGGQMVFYDKNGDPTDVPADTQNNESLLGENTRMRGALELIAGELAQHTKYSWEIQSVLRANTAKATLAGCRVYRGANGKLTTHRPATDVLLPTEETDNF